MRPLSEKDIALPVVPMFHANAWGMPFAAVWFGTSLVLPGPYFTPKLIAELIEQRTSDHYCWCPNDLAWIVKRT